MNAARAFAWPRSTSDWQFLQEYNYIYIYIHINVYMYSHTQTYTYVYTYIYIYTIKQIKHVPLHAILIFSNLFCVLEPRLGAAGIFPMRGSRAWEPSQIENRSRTLKGPKYPNMVCIYGFHVSHRDNDFGNVPSSWVLGSLGGRCARILRISGSSLAVRHFQCKDHSQRLHVAL